MERCAFLSIDSLQEFECYDHLLFEPFNNRGWEVDTVSWHSETVDWNLYDAVIIRSCWDYHKHARRFLEVLGVIDASSAVLANSLDLVKWNINKKYLKDLQEQDIPIVPTLWADDIKSVAFEEIFSILGTDELIIKPTVGAGADDTFRINKEDPGESLTKATGTLSGRTVMIQPFMQNIITEGEYSLFYFNGRYSHAILKTPESADFRAQEEHGGRLKTVKAGQEMLKAAEKVKQAVPGRPLYNRIDFVKADGSFLVMEVELIEPSLYFNMDSESPRRFTEAFINWLAEIG